MSGKISIGSSHSVIAVCEFNLFLKFFFRIREKPQLSKGVLVLGKHIATATTAAKFFTN